MTNSAARDLVHRSGCPCRSGLGLRRTLRADLDRCRVLAEVHEDGDGVLSLLRALLLYPGFYGVAAYRLSHLALHGLPRPFNRFAYLPVLLLHRLVIAVTRVEISAQAHIGPGLFVNHAQGAVVGPVVAGRNLTLSHWSSIGLGGNAALGGRSGDGPIVPAQRSAAGRCPRLGDRVWVGIGAVVGGSIEVGDDALIGANAVVSRDVAPRAVVTGSPACVTSRRGSFGFVHYRGMHDDPARAASLTESVAGDDRARATERG